jgi:hypothetical protein
VQGELGLRRRLHRREHDRQRLRRTARHHGVDRHLLDGGLAVVGRQHRDHLLRVAARVLQHRDDALRRGRHHRQAVGDAAVEEGLERILERADLDRTRADSALPAGRPGGEASRHVGIAGAAGAARPELGQPTRVELDPRLARQLGQPVALDPLDAVALVVPVEQDECRHGVGIEPRGELEILVELRHPREPQPLGLGRGLVRLGLRHHAHAGPVERRQKLIADGTVVLHQSDELHKPTLHRDFHLSPV